MRMVGLRFGLIAGSIAALAVLVGPAFGQLRGGSQRLDEPPVTSGDVEAMARILSLDDEQREVVRGMVEAELASFEAELARFQRVQEGFREDMRERRGDPDMMISLLEKVSDFRAYRDGVREDLFGEVRELVLSEAQLERWGRFERHHRRQRIDEIDTGALSGGAVDLIGLVNEMDVDPETRENLDSVLDRYAKELDEVIRRRIEMADEFSERQIEGMKERGPNPMAMMDIYEEMFEETREVVLEAREITEKYERLIAASLGEGTRGAFRRAFDRAFVPRVYGRSRAAEAVETALSMESLTEGQRTELETLEEAYRREARPINRRWAEALLEHEAERMTIMEVFGPGGVQDEAVREAARARRDLDDRYIEKVAAALTPEQREQLPERSRGDWRDEEFGG